MVKAEVWCICRQQGNCDGVSVWTSQERAAAEEEL